MSRWNDQREEIRRDRATMGRWSKNFLIATAPTLKRERKEKHRDTSHCLVLFTGTRHSNLEVLLPWQIRSDDSGADNCWGAKATSCWQDSFFMIDMKISPQGYVFFSFFRSFSSVYWFNYTRVFSFRPRVSSIESWVIAAIPELTLFRLTVEPYPEQAGWLLVVVHLTRCQREWKWKETLLLPLLLWMVQSLFLVIENGILFMRGREVVVLSCVSLLTNDEWRLSVSNTCGERKRKDAVLLSCRRTVFYPQLFLDEEYVTIDQRVMNKLLCDVRNSSRRNYLRSKLFTTITRITSLLWNENNVVS